MRTNLFDYPLPADLIAQAPAPVRDESRLMLVDRTAGRIAHHVFRELPDLLKAGDLLVVNNTRVLPGRLRGRKKGTGGAVELLLLERHRPGTWRVLCGGARLHPGTGVELPRGIVGTVVEGPAGGKALMRFSLPTPGDVDEALLAAGEVPLPPYIRTGVPDPERYQTVYAEREISSAAPTAGLHFTDALLERLEASGVGRAALELAVGTDTFIPVREPETDDHDMHSEWFRVPHECARLVGGTREAGGRIVAVGTTVVRALESAALPDGTVEPFEGRTDLFITPGYRFRAVDVLLTNFHFPRTTLLMLVCAFGGRGLVLEAYNTAVAERYRFYSFGDAMLIT